MIHFRFFAVLSLAIFSTSSAMASLTLTLDAGATDLSNLTVGDTFTLDVFLGGLGATELSSLGGAVEFPAATFGTPSNSQAGSIVPDPTDLFVTELPGTADALFFAFNGGNIVSEGLFFSFELTALAAGSGSFTFGDFPSATDAFFEPIFDFETNELSFTVVDNQVVVPEASSVLVWSLMSLTAIGALFTRSRLRTSPSARRFTASTP